MQSVNSILFANCGGLGNAIEASSTLVKLRQKYPEAYITFVYDKYSVGVWSYWLQSGLINKAIYVQDILQDASHITFDLCVCTDNGGPFANLLHHQQIEAKVILQSPFWLWETGAMLTESQLVYKTLNQIGITDPMPPYAPLVPVRENHKGVVIGIGYQKSTIFRDWSDKHYGDVEYARLIHCLLKRGIHTTLVGSSADWDANGSKIVENLKEICPDLIGKPDFGFLNTCGKITLDETIRTIGKAKLYVGNESGLGIVAAAQGVDVMFLYTEKQWKNKWPYWRNIPVGVHYSWLFGENPEGVADAVAKRL